MKGPNDNCTSLIITIMMLLLRLTSYKRNLKIGFELWTSGIGSDRSTN